MSQTLTISDQLLTQLEDSAWRRGLPNVEQLLETWQAGEEELVRFPSLVEQWKHDTAHYSNIAKRALHPAYQEIIGMGERVVPLLLAELHREADDWFWALYAITGADPVPSASSGNLKEMTEAWLQWGLEKGYKI